PPGLLFEGHGEREPAPLVSERPEQRFEIALTAFDGLVCPRQTEHFVRGAVDRRGFGMRDRLPEHRESGLRRRRDIRFRVSSGYRSPRRTGHGQHPLFGVVLHQSRYSATARSCSSPVTLKTDLPVLPGATTK